MRMQSTWGKCSSAAVLVTVLLACGGAEPKTGTTSKQGDGLFAVAAQSRGAKAAPARKPGRSALMRGPESAAPAAADTTIRGTLAQGDAVLESDGSYVDYHTYQGRRGERLSITLESSEFDAYLFLAAGSPASYELLADDDDGGGGTNARIDITLPADGDYTILVNSYAAGETGAYVLRVGLGSVGPTPTTGTLGRNTPVQGQLSSTDPPLESDGTYYDAWTFDGRAGEQVTLTMRSEEFDTYLIVGIGSPGDLELLGEDDDGGGGTDSQVMVRLPEDGTYTVLANSYEIAEGAYTLLLESAEAVDYTERYPGGGDPNGRYALLVGIDDYPGTDSDLSSSVADVRLMEQTLIDEFGYSPANIVTLTDHEANRDHIINAFSRHLGQAGPAGTALFFYSGHGFQLDDNVGVGLPDDPEPGDSRDEALYVWGYDEQSTTVLDDELGYLIDQLSTDRTLVMLDSCASGSGTRGGSAKFVTAEDAAPFLRLPRRFIGEAKAASGTGAGATGMFDTASTRRPHVLLAGSQENAFSFTAEGWPDHGGVASVFTYYVVTELERATPETTFEQLLDRVRTQAESYSARERLTPPQVPQVGGELARTRVLSFFRN